MIRNFTQFRALNESKLAFTERFLNVLAAMPSDNIVRNHLLDLQRSGVELDLVQNYFDLGQNPAEVNAILDRRAKALLDDTSTPLKYRTKSSVGAGGTQLTFSQKSDGTYTNIAIFRRLGFDPETMPGVNLRGDQIGEIVSETESKTPGKIWALFKWNDSYTVVNKDFLEIFDDRYNRIWELPSSPIRLGRALTPIFRASNITVPQAEIEKFVNSFRATAEFLQSAFSKFDIVKGDAIAHWYNGSNYEEGGRSTLGSSCMRNMEDETFELYTQNPEVCSLVILYGNNGTIVDGKYKSNKIRGRALLWNTTSGDVFMDRIYTNHDQDVDLFKQFADENGWWYKKYQDSSVVFTAVSKSSEKQPYYTVNLNPSYDSRYAPYVDTLCYMDDDKTFISNSDDDTYYEMRHTEGNLDYDDDYDD